ncbi:MAG: pyruvate, water dikinase [Syntrophobacterales bacterium]|nr:pyruvate, water dikinase [Syntrophobacterales bacterium]
MSGFLTRLKNLLSRPPAKPPAAAMEDLRRTFRAKFHAFKVLLNANNTALALMAEMETTLHGQRSFGLTFVRGHATAVCVNVYNIIRALNDLSGHRYTALLPVFEDLREKIEAVLNRENPPAVQELVLPLEQVTRDMADGVGSKMANLGEISRALPEVAVPPGFVITAAAYDLFLRHNGLKEEINRRLQAMEQGGLDDLYRLSSEIQLEIIRGEVPPELAAAITDAYAQLAARLGQAPKVAMRSSAIGEDAVETSFAGQYRSELNVSPDNLLSAYKEILASKYALTALTYRLHKGLRDEDVPMCVGCMAMVEAASGGVMYSRDPTDIRRRVVLINSVHGLAKAVVDGTVTPDVWEIDLETWTVRRREIAHKPRRAVTLPGEGVVLEDNPAADEPSLTEEQALRLARLAVRLEEHFRSPQDIEWSIDGAGQIFILQSRPLQQLVAPSAADRPAPEGLTHRVLLRGGERASPGVAAGPVCLVKNNLDVLQFPEGAVLVTAFAHPAWATLLPRAAAVVTDRGGITGHLANVAREFGIPALFNTFEATRLLTPGLEVTVDADGHSIYEGRVEELLAHAAPKKGVMLGTPVYETLKEVMTYITPLYLTDPDSPAFRPENCRSLHDITRFAHEVAVREMFTIEEDRALTRYFIKRLKTDLPMEWLVLNLEDGFKEEVPGREVTLDQIASVPMLALWDGISAVPWEGPPPVDTGGFLSIVLGAATDPHLATAGERTLYGNVNYFMISRSFCNLTSRLGFHFSTVEALTGDEPFENYLRFSFKGGAADHPRRVLRAQFVAEILEMYDFKVEVREDALFARLEGEALPYMLTRLRVLGYVTIHTRQLDMIMLNPEEVARYRAKILGDLERLTRAGTPPPEAGGSPELP